MAFWSSEWWDLFFRALPPTQSNFSKFFLTERFNWVLSFQGRLWPARFIMWFLSYGSRKSGYTLTNFRKNVTFELELLARRFRVLPVGLQISSIPWKAKKLYFWLRKISRRFDHSCVRGRSKTTTLFWSTNHGHTSGQTVLSSTPVKSTGSKLSNKVLTRFLE